MMQSVKLTNRLSNLYVNNDIYILLSHNVINVTNVINVPSLGLSFMYSDSFILRKY